MSRMRDIIIDVQDYIEQNIFSYEEIARLTGAPLSFVYALGKEMTTPKQEPLYECDNS